LSYKFLVLIHRMHRTRYHKSIIYVVTSVRTSNVASILKFWDKIVLHSHKTCYCRVCFIQRVCMCYRFHKVLRTTYIPRILILSKFFIHQLMHKWVVLKTILKFTLKLTFYCKCFNVNFIVNFKIVFKTVHFCISWWIKNFDYINFLHAWYIHSTCILVLLNWEASPFWILFLICFQFLKIESLKIHLNSTFSINWIWVQIVL
jgi:hypothetical protein